MDVCYANVVKRNADTGNLISSVGSALINGYSARCLLRVAKLENGVLERHLLRRGQAIPVHYWR